MVVPAIRLYPPASAQKANQRGGMPATIGAKTNGGRAAQCFIHKPFSTIPPPKTTIPFTDKTSVFVDKTSVFADKTSVL